MRQIKFRAWKKNESPEMINNVDFIDWKNGVIGFDYPLSEWTSREDEESLNNIILMQYTGYGNSHDGDLYEGDIIKHLYRQYIGHGEVEELEEIVFIKDIRNLPFDESSLGFEILGNIYENPELLEENAE